MKLTITAKVAYCLSCDVRRHAVRTSGFAPAPTDLGSGEKTYGELRLRGFAAAVRTEFTREVVIVGGQEARFPHVNRAQAIAEMLIKDHGLPAIQVRSIASKSNTGGNLIAIQQDMAGNRLGEEEVAVLSSFFHLPRTGVDCRLRLFPAESFLLLAGYSLRGIIEDLDGGPLAKRIAIEIQGIADKLRGNYVPRTDTKLQ